MNRFLIPQLVETVVAGLEGHTAVDLYAGVGLFARALARCYRQVIAVEAGVTAAGDLEMNMQQHAGGVEVQRISAEEFLARQGSPPDLIIADPPRSGLGSIVAGELVRLRVPVVRIVSCDPATLSRDLQAMLAAGYEIKKLTLVDLFPQTYHLETVAELRWTKH